MAPCAFCLSARIDDSRESIYGEMMIDSPDKWMCDIEGCLEPADYVTKHADHRKCREHFFWGLLREEIELEKLRETIPEFDRLREAWHFFVKETMKPPSIFDVAAPFG